MIFYGGLVPKVYSVKYQHLPSFHVYRPHHQIIFKICISISVSTIHSPLHWLLCQLSPPCHHCVIVIIIIIIIIVVKISENQGVESEYWGRVRM